MPESLGMLLAAAARKGSPRPDLWCHPSDERMVWAVVGEFPFLLRPTVRTTMNVTRGLAVLADHEPRPVVTIDPGRSL